MKTAFVNYLEFQYEQVAHISLGRIIGRVAAHRPPAHDRPGSWWPCGLIDQAEIQPGNVFEIHTTGGCGYGDA